MMPVEFSAAPVCKGRSLRGGQRGLIPRCGRDPRLLAYGEQVIPILFPTAAQGGWQRRGAAAASPLMAGRIGKH